MYCCLSRKEADLAGTDATGGSAMAEDRSVTEGQEGNGGLEGSSAAQDEAVAGQQPVKEDQAAADKPMKSTKSILQKAKEREEELKRVYFGILCVDEGSWPEEVKVVDSDAGVMRWARCKGVTRETLVSQELDEAACKAICDCYKVLSDLNGSVLSGVSADMGQLWLKHQRAVRRIIGNDTPVYLSPIVQLPMISACFKSFENTLLVTWDPKSESEEMKKNFVKDSQLEVADVERLEILGINADDPKWTSFMNWSATEEEHRELGVRLCSLIEERVQEFNAGSKKDHLIKAVILTASLSSMSVYVRNNLSMPVFDVSTLLRFFKSGRAASYYNDVSVLARLQQKMRPSKDSDAVSRKATEKLGLIQLDYSFPSTFGDLEFPGTFGFKTIAEVVKGGLYFELAQAGSFEPAILEEMQNVIQDLEAQGVMGLTGNCGFMMHYQCFARHVAKVPVFMSSLIQASTLAAAINPEERVLILTANSESLAPGKDKLLRDSGINVSDSDRFVILGLQTLDGFDAVANAERVDTIRVQNALSKFIPEVIEQENAKPGLGRIAMILMECTELPHFADGLRQVTGLPVFDAVTLVNYFYIATASKNWNTKVYTPHNVAFWNKSFKKSGTKVDFASIAKEASGKA
eukprot:CAMPEP_0170623174 /NCGR_PEP_ID=MMETSP0224-20130122/29548_1 /TAXON_ID=285029 /ORGANISM="Togula jolla, Strain CCCM 725" /LENGTH=633 /DNA_ID=CAMNT_0010949591 /DNA_START=59 /DNA_END=1959 /DNA_ORIENTATION=-